MTFIPDVPGRGAWTRAGGLLPPPSKPASQSGYYRAAMGTEVPIGKEVVQGKATSDSYMCVWWGAKIIQGLLNNSMQFQLVEDGWLGPKTDTQVRAFQNLHHLVPDGLIGPNTMRELLLADVVRIASQYRVPLAILGGLAVQESQLCPAAVGQNGYDHGLLAINLQVHYEKVTWANAMDPVFSLVWAARELRTTYDEWVGKTTADPWDIAIANHNSPRAARQWAEAGHPVDDPKRLFPIQQYVDSVKEAW